MSRDKLNELPMYDGIFNVYTDMEMFNLYAYDETTTVFVITDDFIKCFFKENDLSETVTEILRIRPKLNIVILGENIRFNIAGTYTIKEKWDIPTHTSNLVSNLHNLEKSVSTDKNEKIYRDFKLNSFDSQNLIFYILSNPNESMNFVRELLKEYKKSNIDSWALSNKAAALSMENVNLNDKLSDAEKRYKALSKSYNKLKFRHDELIRKINFKYCVPYEEKGNEGFKPAVLNYDKILYIKEVSAVKYTQTMIYYLQNIMNTVSNKHTRCIVIEKPGAFSLEPLYKCFIPHYRLTHGDLKNSDILMVGYQKDIMLSVLQNTAQNGYLIVWDRTGNDSIYVKNTKVRVLYTMSDLNDNEYFKYPVKNILSYDKSVKHIRYIKDFEKMDAQEKLKAHSSQEIINELIKTLET